MAIVPGMKRKRALFLVLAAVVSDYIGVTMMRTVLPFYAKSLGGSGTLIGGMETAYGAGQWIGSLTVPRLSDTLGRRSALLFCLLCSVVGYGLALASLRAASPALLLVSRFPVGFAKQTVTVSRAVVADCTDASDERSRWMSFLGTALGIGCTMGPLLAVWAAEISEHAPVIGALFVFSFLSPAVAVLLPETAPRPAAGDGNKVSANASKKAPLWRDRRIVVVLLVLGLPELGLVCHEGVAKNTFAVHHLQQSKQWIANLNSAISAMQAAFAGGLCTSLAAKGWSDVALLQLGSASFALTSAAIFLWQSPEAMVLSAPAAALANGVLRSIPPAFLSKHVPWDCQGQAMGLLDVCSAALRVLAPVLGGAIMDSFGAGSVFLGQAVLFACSCVCLSFFARAPGVAACAATEEKVRGKTS